jgi:hypothetical protein
VLEIRAVTYTESGEVAFCEESEADAFGIFFVDGEEVLWVADFADYGWACKFAKTYAEEVDTVCVDRVREVVQMLP